MTVDAQLAVDLLATLRGLAVQALDESPMIDPAFVLGQRLHAEQCERRLERLLTFRASCRDLGKVLHEVEKLLTSCQLRGQAFGHQGRRVGLAGRDLRLVDADHGALASDVAQQQRTVLFPGWQPAQRATVLEPQQQRTIALTKLFGRTKQRIDQVLASTGGGGQRRRLRQVGSQRRQAALWQVTLRTGQTLLVKEQRAAAGVALLLRFAGQCRRRRLIERLHPWTQRLGCGQATAYARPQQNR